MATLLQRSCTFRDVDLSRKLLLALNSQRTYSQFCDVVLRVCGTQIFAHASVLAAASPYFNSFLGIGSDCPRAFSQKQPQVIEIHIDNVLINEGDGGYGEAVCKVVEYMYTSEMNISTNLLGQIIEIARIMLLDQLLFYCEEFQRGVEGNKPKTVSTCTSTLMEVVSLLGTPNKKSLRTIDAQTETEETLFAKISDQSPAVFDSSSSNTLILSSKGVLSGIKRINFVNVSPEDKKNDTPDYNAVKSEVDDESLIFHSNSSHEESDSEKRCNVKTETSTEIQQNDSESFNIGEKSTPSSNEIDNLADLPTECETEENFIAIKSFEDILDYDSVATSSGVVEVKENELSGLKSDLNKLNDQPLLLTENVPVTDTITPVELEDISDLVTFNSVTSAYPSKVKSRGAGRPRGRPKKRKRGRPKGRRELDRSNECDAESDYEFERLIDKLEKGENVEPPESDRATEDRTISTSNSLQSCSSLIVKKSSRIKSRPSQLKKDYILHSIRKKTRKRCGTTIHDRTPMQQVQRVTVTEPVDNILRFVCQKCDYTTTVFKAYVNHLNAHSEKNMKCFLCHECGFKTSKSRQFKKHKEKHMAEQLICVYCQFKASNITEYQEHKLKHSGNLPYFCNLCDSRFKKRCQLESHKPKHWLQKPFICPVCKSGFKWKHALKNHMITHTTVKDHLCDICGYATAHKSMLTSHRLLHSGETFKCSAEGCHFEATKRQKLKMHMLTHTREKPHQCEVCGQRFSLAKNMRRHLLLHSNTRPIACKICSFKTTRYDKLKDHNLKVHNIGCPPEPKKIQAGDVPSPSTEVSSTVTIVTTESVTLNPDGTISAETLQKIAQLAAAQQNCNRGAIELSSEDTTINIEPPNPDGSGLPIVAHIHYSETDVEDTEPIQYLEEIEEN